MNNVSKLAGKSAVLCFSGNKGGMEYDAAILTKNIIQYFGQGHLICRDGTWLSNYAHDNNIPCTAITFSGMISLRAALRLKRIYESLDITNIIFFGSSEMPTLYAGYSNRIKSFIVRHGTTKSHSKKDFIHQITWSRVTSHWCISHHIENNVKKIFPVGVSKTFVNYVSLGEKLDKIRIAAEINKDDNVFKIVHVGRLVEGKGQRDAIEIVRKLHDAGIEAQLTLYGQGEDESYLRHLSFKLGLTSHVIFAGHSELPYLNFHQYHAFLFPSHGEGLGNAFIEALASGMHCFCYKNTVFPELHNLGLEFTISPNHDIEALSLSLLDTWRQRKKNPVQNIQLCKKIFSTKNEMDTLYRYLS